MKPPTTKPTEPAHMNGLTTLAFFLPQFHPIAENNRWWGEGFTEWTHLQRARSWRPAHRIRRPIGPMGEYDLRDPATLEAHWSLAEQGGLSGFAVWHYWFGGGRRLLERPAELVLAHRLRFRYSLAWANHSWYDKSRKRLLMTQSYPGQQDVVRHFEAAARHFHNDQYVRVGGKPVFTIFDPIAIPDFPSFVDTWRSRALASGLPGIHLVGDRLTPEHPYAKLVDTYTESFSFLRRRNKSALNLIKEQIEERLGIPVGPRWYDFRRFIRDIVPEGANAAFAPTVMTGWDTTPRHGPRGVVYEHLNAGTLRAQLQEASSHFARWPASPHLLFVKSWNEWAEGNTTEPDDINGTALLDALRDFHRSRLV